MIKKYNVSPMIKWAGGKRQLLGDIKLRMPKKFNKYLEPFVGGGAVLFELQPEDAVINDINKALINLYCQVQRNPEKVIQRVLVLDNGIMEYELDKESAKQYYYLQRELYNNKLMRNEYDVLLAALLLFLNKHCFNGLYRVNGKGIFNVPYNGSTRPSVDEKLIMENARFLQDVKILNGDFAVICELAEPQDFVFFDSPYAPLNATSFESYTKEGFDRESHIRLAQLFQKLTDKGCFCMLTNHNTPFIKELYKDYKIDVIAVKRMINSDANHRTGEEVIVCNY